MDTIEKATINKNTIEPFLNKKLNSWHLPDSIQLPLLPQNLKPDWLRGDGEIANIIRSKDWSTTPLGPIGLWPQSLQTTISLCLASNFPINILWGTDGIQIYNKGYKVLCGAVHPQAIGESYRVTWKSAWPALGEPFEKALLGETSFLENQRMFLHRNGYLEETFFTFSLSPIRDETGAVVGVFHPVTETTNAMINQRRTRLLRDMSCEAANSDNIHEAVLRIARTLEDYKSDIPGALILLEDANGDLLTFATTKGIEGLTDLRKWPIKEVLEEAQPYYINDMENRFGKIASPEYGDPIQRACLLPIRIIGQKKPIGFIAALLSTRLPYNESYMAFFDMFNNSVNLAITNARSNEIVAAEHSALKTLNVRLEEDRRVSEQIEQQLRDSKTTAEAATQSKSAFLANMSHEIRTPLAAILGFTEILKSPEVNSQDKEKYLGIISRNGNALVRIIDDILDLSKIEAGKINIENAPVCLTELISDIVIMFSDRATGKGLTLNFDSRDLPKFKIDSDAIRIRQILVNLLGNAIKFTTVGGVTIYGSYKEIENEKLKITFTVNDTGIGITEPQSAGLFQAFNQADNSTTRHYGGTGLGLALSKKLAKALGGNILLQKKSGSAGTTFAFHIVGKKSLVTEKIESSAAAASPKSIEQRLKDWQILVVDDSLDNRVLLRILLEREGATVQDAAGADEGILKTQKSHFDVVLMDIQMPGLDGYQALSKLRANNYKRPIFALTAHTMKEERDRAIAAGFTGHISKPVNPLILVETLLIHAGRLH